MPDSGRSRRNDSWTPSGRPLTGLRFAVAGPGRVGRSLARWAVSAGAEPVLVLRRDGSTPPIFPLRDVPATSFEAVLDSGSDFGSQVDVLLLTVSDRALAEVASAWAASWGPLSSNAASSRPAPFPVVLHSSGCHDAEVLAPLRRAGVAVGSLHPLRAFPQVVEAPGPHPFFAIDGDAEAIAVARRLVGAWGGTPCELSGQRRVVYHLAASLAAGGVVTTLAAVTELMRRAELPDEVLGGYLGLLRGAVDAAEEAARKGGPGALASAVTGPAARGDTATLERHRAALDQIAPELAPTVEASWRETRRQTLDPAAARAAPGKTPGTPESTPT